MISGKRWRFVTLGFVMMLVLGFLDSWSIFVMPMEQEFGWRRDQTALAYSLAMTCFSFGILLGGPLVDRKGPRFMTAIAGSLLCIGFFAVSYISCLLHLYFAYSLLCGLAIGLLYNCIIATVVRWFPDRRGLVAGALTVGTGVGSMALGMWVAPLLQLISWRIVLRLLGFSALLLIVCTGQLLRSPGAGQTAQPGVSKAFGRRRDYEWHEVIREPAFWGIWAWHLFVIAGGQSVLAHIVPFGVEQGVPADQAAVAMGGLAVSNACGRLLCGYFADRAGRKLVMMLGGATMTAGMLCMASIVPYYGFTGLMLSAILVGIGYGGTIPQVSAVVGDYFGAKHFGANFGLASTGIAVAAIIGPYLSGCIKTFTGDYEQSFLLLASLALVSSIVPLFIHDPQTRRKAKASCNKAAKDL